MRWTEGQEEGEVAIVQVRGAGGKGGRQKGLNKVLHGLRGRQHMRCLASPC